MKLCFCGRAFGLCLKGAITIEPTDKAYFVCSYMQSIEWKMTH